LSTRAFDRVISNSFIILFPPRAELMGSEKTIRRGAEPNLRRRAGRFQPYP